MAETKVTPMLLKVDLQCPRCYRKIKKLLCKFHEIRDQLFDEKQNTVMINVICCSPERIRQKLICKGGKTIKSIEIIKPKPPPPPPADKPKPEPEKPKPEPEKPKSKPDQPPAQKPPKDAPAKPPPPEKQPAPPKQAPAEKPPPTKAPEPAPKPKETPPPVQPAEPGPKPPPPPQQTPPPPMMPAPVGCLTPVPVGYCYPQYYCNPNQEWPPCYPGGCGTPPPPPPFYGRPCHCGCGGRRYCSSRCDYFSEENPSACSIM